MIVEKKIFALPSLACDRLRLRACAALDRARRQGLRPARDRARRRQRRLPRAQDAADAVMTGALWPYLMLIAFGFLPSEIWRVLAVFLARGFDERAEIFVWVRAVATTLVAGVVAKILIAPAGAL